MSENNNAVIPRPTQNPRNSFPAWRLPNGTINASDADLETASSSCGTWEWGCAAVVVGALIAEFIIAYIHPAYDSVLNRLVTAAADAAIAIGIVGEVIFSRKDARIQTELRSRSNKQLAIAMETAGQANARAEEANLARIKLEALIAPRRLDSKEQAALAKRLRTYSGKKIRIESYSVDVESEFLASQIRDALVSIFTIDNWISGERGSGASLGELA